MLLSTGVKPSKWQLQKKITDDQNAKLRLQELENLDERRFAAMQSIKIYQARMVGSFDKKVRERVLKKGDLVLAIRTPMILTHKPKGKFEPKWE